MAVVENNARLSAFVNFPSPYTQSLLERALVAVLPALSLSSSPPDEAAPPRLQWADYDLLAFDVPRHDARFLISSYVYRKALIRKHQLHTTVAEYLAKCEHRGVESALVRGMPKGWVLDIQFADELDEMLMDDLYELDAGMRENEGREEDERAWFILKPGFAERGQGIRMFSTEDELRAIFEEFEPPSSDEEDEEELARHTGEIDLDAEEEEGGTAILTSHMRHFVIQEYVPRPVLFDLHEGSDDALLGQKFHLRAYVLVTGAYTVHLAHTMLALFSGSPYTPPRNVEGELDLRPHLTNTCLQTDAFGQPVGEDDLVRLFWDLEAATALTRTKGGYAAAGVVDHAWLEATFAKVGDVVAETVKAGAECGSFNLQLMENAFEIFGVDLLLSHPADAAPDTLAVPEVSLLEFNASPDFVQSGDALRPRLLDMFKGVVRLAIAPFFGIDTVDAEERGTEEDMVLGEERWGWRLVGKGEVRGGW
ncbi:hypothetical protein CC85DRAFT_309441 [Cutaneotrichosporon oleaginosum]|uniref:TTL-domain-containing protein n=1 Tax=Cutaneotrichosporon oleaginosum TaxID=879819 RepID=A0A0J0XEG4_9TREE|nr:uncharacterized protein CC85DRAFT_309441 [Cutaneotrichosporon oleaginosum]KLT39443.1 hypothetical protein CC85DRAFT_309441 [Cutaneotrichosporon oleaginosum]TXT08449.1 hypothetical protein COLE_05373 [Cutaneotrichosporon oleaginosum]